MTNIIDKTIFVSYNRKDSEIVDQLENDLGIFGISLYRDIREISEGSSIKEFMKKIRKFDFSLMIISDHFLKSECCMFEVLEFVKDENFINRILPIITTEINIFSPDKRASYIQYWIDKKNSLRQTIHTINDLTASSALINDLKHYEKVSAEIGEFLDFLADRHNSMRINNKMQIDYEPLLRILNIEKHLLSNDLRRIIDILDDEEREIQLEQLLIKYPNFHQIKFYLAVNAKRTKKFAKEKMYYEHLIKINFMSSSVYNNYANLLLEHYNEQEQAKEYYLKAIETNEFDYAPYTDFASYLIEYEKDVKQAIIYYEKSLKLNALNAEAYIGLANILSKHTHELDLAKKYYAFAMKIEPKYIPSVFNNYAQNILKDSHRAIKFFKKAILLDHNYFEAHANLGNKYALIGDFDNAISEYKIAITLKENAQVLLTLGLTLFNLKNPEAEQYIARACNADPDFVRQFGIIC